MYAKVIVDVPARETDRAFDYRIPPALRGWVDIGSRVGVPFGSRIVLGFVIDIRQRSEVDEHKLRDIERVLDLSPPLTPELVDLARWISQKYMCREISALQAMVPAALKAKYERVIQAAEEAGEPYASGMLLLPEEERIVAYVREKGGVTAEALLRRFPGQGGAIRRLLQLGTLVERQEMRDKLSRKKVRVVFPPDPPESLRERLDELPAGARRQKDVLRYLLEHPQPIQLTELMLKLSVGAGSVKSLADRGWIRLDEVEVFRDPYESRSFARTSPPPLTAEQQQVFQEISASLAAGRHNIFLVHGVTGSGKTEVYLQAIRRCLELGKEAIVLVPEISLTPQMVERFKGRFGDQVAVLHSRLSHGERYDEWRKIALGKASVAVGARSAVFAPFTRLGLIIIDEEHESSYKQDDHPKYHARDVAIRRGLVNGAVVVLGSATPSLESYCLAAGDLPDGDASAAVESPARDAFRETAAAREAAHPAVSYRLLPMRSRVHGRPLPEVHIVDMREELKAGNRSMFSRPLHQAIEQRLLRKEQTVLLLNRRGYATFVMCRSCGYVIRCPHCDISLTYHLSSRALRCHYCGYAERERDVCPDCASEHIRHFGAGTQRVEEELARLFPGIRVIRMDVDTTAEKGSHEKWLTMFRNRQADVLLGTQMVAKGLDFPNVTLVGVITADTVLNLPDFRSAEKTFQLLTQVAGRAGRHELPGEVFVQTYAPDHYSIVCAGRHDYAGFVREELPLRRLRGYPPFWKLILITLAHEQPAQLIRFAEKLAVRLKELAADAGCPPGRAGAEFGIDILGPVASPIPRIKDRYRFQCMVKYVGNAPVQQIVRRAIGDLEDEAQQAKLAISVDVDPQLLL